MGEVGGGSSSASVATASSSGLRAACGGSRGARANARLRPSGYAALCRDDHPRSAFWPPTCTACVECVHRRDNRWESALARTRVHMMVVYFCDLAPKAHWGKVIRSAECAAAVSATSG
eukprot:6201141-Pleurochrysis_carterae.AAC.3